MFNILFNQFEKNKLLDAENAIKIINNLENEIILLDNIEIKEQIKKLSLQAQSNEDLKNLLPHLNWGNDKLYKDHQIV